MSFKKVVCIIAACITVGLLRGHSTHTPPYRGVFFRKHHLDVETIKKGIDHVVKKTDGSVNLHDRSGATLLVCAVETGEPELVHYLVRTLHADVSVPGVPQKNTAEQNASTILPIDLARERLELSETLEEQEKWQKIIHILRVAERNNDPLM